jgi:hypothetical protein
MKLRATDTRTNLKVYIPKGQLVPACINVGYEPGIRYLDCHLDRGDLGVFECEIDDDMMDFRLHLKSDNHKLKVQGRLFAESAKAKAQAAGADGVHDASDQPPDKRARTTRRAGLRGTD